MVKLYELHFQLLPRSPYSLGLHPSDYFLFANIRKTFAGERHGNIEEAIAETEVFFEIILQERPRNVRAALE